MSTGPASRPLAGEERLTVVDALRGFALAGVLLINVGGFSQFDMIADQSRAALATASFDAWAEPALKFLVDGKAITVFTILFGFGFALQMERAEKRGGSGRGLFLRRLAVLWVIGLLHGELLWWGDILRFYALFGVVLLLFRGASNRTLLWTGLGLALAVPPLLTPVMKGLLAGLPEDAVMTPIAAQAFASPSYLTMLRGNLEYDAYAVFAFWALPFFVFGRFLLGYWAGRKGLLQAPAAHRALLRRLCVGGLIIGLLATTFELLQEKLNWDAAYPWLATGSGKILAALIGRFGPLGLGVAYAAGFVLLHLRPKWRPRLDRLAPVGRMALTNYLLQTVVGVLVFYGIGCGVGPQTGLVGWLIFAVVFFAGQIVFSQWWLRRFQYGPMEWLWRSLVYLRPQPMRRL